MCLQNNQCVLFWIDYNGRLTVIQLFQIFDFIILSMDNLLSIPKLEQIANVACFSLNYQEKQQAERCFLELSKNITTSLIQEILHCGTDTLIFVTIEYTNKLVEEYSLQLLQQIFNAVETQISSWYIPNAHQFRRQNSIQPIASLNSSNINGLVQQPKQVTRYVTNSISFFMSNCMKRFFLQDSIQKRHQIVEWICSRPNERYKLWLFSIFIQNISQIDQSMGFIKFRTLSYNFQEQVIPIISKCLIPFLYCVQDVMKVNEISDLQQNLNVADQSSLKIYMQKQQKIFQNENQFKFAQLVFQLLHHLVFYNFHLTYTQYQQESIFENCLICFPEDFTAKVVTQEFIGSIGYVIDRLIDLMPRSKFLKTTLECLQKIFLTKLSYVDEQKKLSFIKECTTMLTKCLTKPNLDRFILTKLMVCNNKFLNNIEINYLKQKPQLKSAFQQWLLTITKTSFMVLENIQLSQQFNFNLEESLIIECLDVYQKIVSSLCHISYSSFDQNLENSEEKIYIRNNVQAITQILIRKLLVDQSRPLIEDSTAQIFKTNILQIKSFCSCFFQPFKQLASLNYTFFFNQIDKNMDIALNSQQISVKFNLFMLLCEAMDRNFLERNIVMVRCDQDQLLILSNCINKAIKFLQTYLRSKNEVLLNEQIILMDISILIFFDKILSQFLSYFQNHESSIEIKQKIFLNMLKIQNKTAFIANQSQEFILFCVESVLSFLLVYNKYQQSNHINDFIFETINRILMKFKWGIKREVFKNSHIYAKLEQFFCQVEKQTNIKPVIECKGISINLGLFHQFQRLKWRKKLLKIIALLYFDDIIDDYRMNLENIFSALKNQHILTILLDIQGIGEAIDTISIYKTFLELIEKYFNVQALTQKLIGFASSFDGYDKISHKYPKIKIIKEIVKMHKAVLSNKGQRIGNPKNMQSVYRMIQSLINYWVEFIKMSTSEEWVAVVRQIINTVSDLIKCEKINFYLVQRVCGQNYVEFFYQLFTKILQVSERIEENPKFYESFLSLLVQISKQILEVIFFPSTKIKKPELMEKNIHISQTYLQLFLGVFKKIPQFLQQFKLGNSKNQVYLQKSLEIVKSTLLYIDFKKRQNLIHKEQMQEVLTFVAEMKQLIFEYQNQILSYLSTQKHFSVHRRTLIIIMYEGTIIYPDLMLVLIGGMNLPGYLLNEAKECIDCIKRQEQELFIDRMKTWLRMLHMSQEDFKQKKQQNHQFFGFMGIL